ncbi:UDP-N-acetylmuramoyl-tripeptide--D-alanyl-D-alanine ligase [Candidatus Methylacidiphilum fumarolicum]|uniref:UDP-N-acetylmuramoyl-tripeptide--D-alanyl-D-alanine ligase n=2 Tax=Candidatus Methylacidiphilum fumarolicum TaxID=591154 RepID=I0JW37_METFB|nr:UDP-N-acetylmuramoyl-tripeptide--D-alanyl-D-alanine ligase [Candidatus Methylacidiphilum fumarolicum]MBW6415705.1 UDP-N-acetylmuramoyl-tripeptide--D-alanyl-D-alanine ligase [Candidatus Methylacidiphilum fumarolicum]TFE68743.1 UDP-N-acetylmuramyl peptide synthase [Candidatus Methylacidiphilum fumarolicum]TFE71906.1 UDP-N-acetylmuramoyl-tripeptide--D-alanyl-D-alanine ligase [Candidatus Methylacidiphilum fumarolicum]TFE72471.1 UDP-N-acetylmuramoyl-tripeptide--D-alanyl-D-alanine ligase [Candidat
MEQLSVEQIAEWTQGRVIGGKGSVMVGSISTDSRTVKEGDCFLALKGEKYDGLDYVATAAQKGAVAAIVDRELPLSIPLSIPVIRVKNTLEALQQLAFFYRKQLHAKIIAITGSNGKTSTKEMISSVLRVKYKTVSTSGNLNNQIGLPLSILQMDHTTEYGVFELGTNHCGEIASLSRIVAPDIAIITNIGSAHVGNFGSVEAIGWEKTDLLTFVSPKGFSILMEDDEWSKRLSVRSAGQVIWVGNQENSLCWLDQIWLTLKGIRCGISRRGESFEVSLATVSREMAKNALFAAAVGFLSSLSSKEIALGLEKTVFPLGRLTVHPIRMGYLIDDSYNANLQSTMSALRALTEFPFESEKIAVLGSMGELGEHAKALHYKLGVFAGSLPLSFIVFIGPHWKDMVEGVKDAGFPLNAVLGTEDQEEACFQLQKHLNCKLTLLIKGSRFLKLDRIVEKLLSV